MSILREQRERVSCSANEMYGENENALDDLVLMGREDLGGEVCCVSSRNQ